MTDEQIADTSAAAVADVQFDSWDDNGTPIITKEIEPKTQESAPAATPAKEVNSEPEGKTAAESETASRGKKERKPGEKLNAEERIAQLTARNREMEAELKAERERSREAAPKPPVKEPEAVKVEAPKRPNPFNWKGTAEEYETAMEKWEAHQKEQALQEFQRNEAQKAFTQKMQKQLDEAKAKYPDAEDKLKSAVAWYIETPLPLALREMVDASECFTELMYVFDEPTRKNFTETAKTNPGKAIRALVQMESEILSKTSAKPQTEEKSETKPPKEPTPRAPKPPSEVGGRGTAPEDALRTAAQANDFRAFEAEQSRRKFAKN